VRTSSSLLRLSLLGGSIVFASCDAPSRPPTTGAIAPRIQIIKDPQRPSVTFSAVRATVTGPTTKTIDLSLNGAFWEGTATDLTPGTYRVNIEGLNAGEVEYFGEATSVSVTAGGTAEPTLTFQSVVTTMASIAPSVTTAFTLPATFSKVPIATSYSLQWSTSSTFASGTQTISVPDTTGIVTVGDVGTYFVRARPTVTNTSTGAKWSDAVQVQVIDDGTARTVGTATPMAFSNGVPDTIINRNITPGNPQSFFSMPARAGDSLFAETFASRLTIPSTLNSVLTLYRADGTTVLATNDNQLAVAPVSGDNSSNLAAAATTDARIVAVAPETETYLLKVTGASNSVGNYVLVTEQRRLPAAPTTLNVTTISDTQIDLAWADNADNEASYRIERCAGTGCTTFAEVDSVGTDVATYSDHAVAVGNLYRYRVRARNKIGNSAYSSVTDGSTEMPSAPTTLAATTFSGTRIDLTWTDNSSNEIGFKLERCAGPSCNTFTQIATLSANTTSYSDVGAVLNTQYTYRIYAFNAAGTSAFSNEASANTLVPAAPSTLAATVASATQIDLAWTDNSSNETSFRIEQCAGAGCDSDPANFAEIANVAAGVTVYSATVSAGNSYSYRVRARNVSGDSPYSGIVVASTTVPIDPSGLAATTTSGTSIHLAWTDNSSNETTFRIERCAGVGCEGDANNFAEVASVGADVTSYDDAGLSLNTSYTYRIRARNAVGNSGYSTAQPANTNVPATPTTLTATPSGIVANQIDLAWVDASSDETGFRIERCVGVGCTDFAQIATVGAGVTTYSNSGLAADVTYRYRVIAYNASGPSDPSNIATASTNLPAPPTSLFATVASSTQIDLAWIDQASNEDNFVVQRCAGVGCEADESNFAQIAVLAANVVVYSDGSLTPGATYAYRVRATNSVGNSGFSNVSTATLVVPADPTGLSATTVSATKISLTWTDNASNEAAYQVERCAGTACSNFSQVATLAANTTTHIDSIGLSVGESYTYRVIAVNAIGSSAASGTATATTILPNAPSGLDAVTVSNTQINLTWTDNATNETSYEVEQCQGAACTDFAQIAVLGQNAVAYQNTGLTADVVYRYRVRAVNAAGASPYSNIDNAATNFPADPTGLGVIAANSTQINLSWTDNATTEDGYIIERCAGVSCSDFAQIQLVGANIHDYADGTVSADTWYTYRVQAYNANGSSQYSNEATTNTSSAVAPANLTATTASGSQIDLSWTDNSDNELAFEIERCAGAGCEGDVNNFTVLTTVPTNVTSYNDNSVTVNGTYSYRVRAINNVTSSTFTSAATANTILPADPAGASATTISATQIQVTWTDASSNEDGFRVERCVGASCSDFAQLTEVGAGTTLFEDNSVTLGNSYTYRVVAFNVSGTSAFTSNVTATTILPTAPAGVGAATASPTAIDISWTDNSDNELGFRIERCSGISCSSFAEITTVGAGVQTYQNTGLSGNTFYTYRIRAYNASGTSSYAGPATTNTFIPAAPSGLTATTILATQVDLAWTDAANNEAGFKIERCEGAACSNFAQIATVGANVSAYQDISVTEGVQYSYRVRSYNAVGNSATYTNTASTDTQGIPATPSGLSVVANGQTRIDLTWTDNSGNETGFRIERCTGVGCSNFAEITTVSANVTTYADNGVTADASYTYRVRSYFNGSSSYSNTSTTTTFLPADPTTLAAVATSNTVVELTWADNANNETSFDIERCAGASCSTFAVIIALGADAIGYVDNTVAAGVAYTYRVRAHNGAGFSAYTNEASVGTTVPGIPTGLTATTAHASQIDLQWTDNADDETGFYIERCTGASCTDFAQIKDSVSTTPSDAGTATWNDQTVTAGFRYRYRVRAYKTVGGASGYTNIAGAGTDVPADPTAFTVANTGPSSMHLSWTDNADNELSYRVQRCDGAGCGADVSNFVEIASLPANSNQYTDDPVPTGESFTYRVRAVNAVNASSGTSGYSAQRTETTLLPVTPTNLSAVTQSATSIRLTWDDNANNEVSYKIERCMNGGCSDFALIATLDSNVTEFTDSPVLSNQSFTYRVYAERPAGVSGFSNESTALTSFPSDPSALNATTASATQVNLAWTDNAINETAYQVERCDGNGCSNFALIASLGTDAVAYADNTVTLGNAYTYRVRAMGAAGNSQFSNEASAATFLPADPTALTSATTTNAPTIHLGWVDASNNETAFSIERCAGNGCDANPGNFAEITQVAAGGTSYDDTGITLNEHYSYRIRALSVVGPSDYTAVSTSNTFPPTAPSSLVAATTTGTSIRLTWTDNADNEEGYQVERCVGAGCTTFSPLANIPVNSTQYDDTPIGFNESYTYRVRAINAIDVSAFTLESTATTIPPDPASGLNATVINGGRIDLTWTDKSDNENSFLIERCTGAGCSSFAVIDSAAANAAAFSDLSVTTNLSYTYRVRANNYALTADPTNESTVNTFLPGSPTGFTVAAVSGTEVDLAWTDNANNETGYSVERCSGGGCTFTEIASLPAGTQNYTDNAAPFGVINGYRVRAFNVAGPSGYAGPLGASTILNPPTGERAFTIGRTAIRVRWNDNSGIETGYQIERCAGEGCSSFSALASLPANDTSFIDNTVAAATEYTYRVRAITSGGTAGFFRAATARTPIPVASGAVIGGIADTTGGERQYVISVPAVRPTLVVTLNGSSAANVYVRRAAVPTVVGAPQNADTLCVPFSGSTTETCNFYAPQNTDYFIMMQGAGSYSGASLSVSIGANAFAFTTCGMSGPTGPSQANCDAAYAGTSLEGRVSVTAGGVQNFTFPYPGTYRVTSMGAAGAAAGPYGGGTPAYPGGRGALVRSDAFIPQGITASVLVGQMGTGYGVGYSGGGGGATYYVVGGYQWVVAGGGGGTRADALQAGCDGRPDDYAGQGSASINSGFACPVKATNLYSSGVISSSSWGSGGGGYSGVDGGADTPWGAGGKVYTSGSMFGGTSPSPCGPAAPGGFGGGGSGDGCLGGGGGGGISGGDGGWIAGGGGSYLAFGTNYVRSVGSYNSHGFVVIQWIGP
jgi:titin